jgi:trigger factor
MASNSRPYIPLPVQREVRQRCGFGCVICGFPLYEYEHMLGWANVQRHVAEEITLLCDRHHREKTAGLLPLAEVEQANAQPYNLREGTSKPYDLHYSGTSCEAVIGGNRFTTADAGYGTIMVPVSIDGIPVLGFILGDGHLLLNLNLFDEFNQLVLQIRNNELVYRADAWDIELVGRRLVVREAQRKIFIDIEFEVPNRIVVNRGRFLCNGVEVLVRPDHILVTNNATLISGCSAVNCPGGLVIGPHQKPLGGFMALPSIPRYLGDRTEAIRWAKETLGESAV